VHLLQNIETFVFIVLLLLSCVMYSWAFFRLIAQRTLPDAVAPPRITLLALGLCALKAILGASVAWLQMPITVIVIVTCTFAVAGIFRNVFLARRLPLEERTSVDRWAVLMIPPICGIALLSLQLSITDAQVNLLINGFIFANVIPAGYFLVQLPFVLARRRA
jgi:hypothetical protein